MLSNSTVATRRDGVTGNVLAGVRAQVDPAKFIMAPEGPRKQSNIYVALGLNIVADDYIDVVGDTGSTRTGKVSFAEPVEGNRGYLWLIVDGGLLPS